jgi:mono/diheme cytochrome c family protein
MKIANMTAALAALSACVIAAAPDARAETALERGTYLMNGIVACGNCHTPQDGPMAGKELAGGTPFGGPDAPFTTFAANVTQDKETGIGNWTDAEIIAGIREGKRPDGSLIGPPMPFELYRDLSDTDVKALVAYLRTVAPVANKVPAAEIRFPMPPSYGPPVGNVADVPADDPVAYGKYLAGPAGHCVECHSPLVQGRPDFEHQLGRGGQAFPGPWGVSVARNITAHREDGLGAWTDAEIKRAITEGISKDGSKLAPPMGFPYYKNIKDGDLNAVVAYLRTLPAMANTK